MRSSSLSRPSSFTKRKTTSSPSQPKPPPFSSDNTVIWSNIAFISGGGDGDDRSNVGSNTILSSPPNNNKNKNSLSSMHVTDEELRIREELGKEIEKELEREIMEGILVLVQRLSDLKAKQITRSLKNSHLDEFLSEIYGSSCCSLCRVGGDVREEVYEGSDIESTTEKWGYIRKKMERRF